MSSFRFTVQGPPVGKQRARVFRDRDTGKIIAATPKRTREYERAVKFVARLLLPHGWPTDRSYRLRVAFTGRSDVDNVFKAVADALQGVCYANDRQITAAGCERLPERDPARTEILIEVLP